MCPGMATMGRHGRLQCLIDILLPRPTMPIEYTLLSILFALVQVALYLFVGRGAMYVLAGAVREQNFVYQLFKKGTEPLVKATRIITPRFVIDRHLPFVTFILLMWIGLLLIYARRAVCVAQQLNCA